MNRLVPEAAIEVTGRRGTTATATTLLRVLGTAGLTSLGVGGTIGTGIFVMAGQAAKEVAGPAVILSFLVAAIVCGCAALCYAALAARYPAAGSAYAYARPLAPPFVAWLVGWNLILQYTVAASSIAQGWSHYLQDAIHAVFGPNMAFPTAVSNAGALFRAGSGFLDLPAVLAIAVLTGLLLRGITPSVFVNHVIVAIKLAVILLILCVGGFYVHPENWVPFAPFGWGGLQLPFLSTGGPPQGMLAGAAIVFYAYLGFEALTNYSEETRAPQRDIPRSILRSLGICTLLYMAMAVVVTGMVRYDALSKEAPISAAFGQVGLPWIRTIVAVGALVGITSVLLIILLSLPRVLMAISRDGILPDRFFARIAPNGVPVNATLSGSVFVGVLAAFIPLDMLGLVAVMANMVTFIAVAVLVLCVPKTEHTDSFPLPLGPVAPVVTIGMCLLLLLSLPWFFWIGLLLWWGMGAVVYAVRRGQVAVRLSDAVEVT
jgi:APA family basic amino acid/polyamine antiporter